MTEHELFHCPNHFHRSDRKVSYSWVKLCAICGGVEGSLPTECPGVSMTGDQKASVQAGQLDYRDGEWVAMEQHCETEMTPHRKAINLCLVLAENLEAHQKDQFSPPWTWAEFQGLLNKVRRQALKCGIKGAPK